MLAAQIYQLKKNYGKLEALKGIDLEIPSGEFFGLLGPNGAGKSTLINCMTGLVKPSEGKVKIFGHEVQKEPQAAKSLIGFSPQEVNVDRFFNLRKTLEFQGGFHGLSTQLAKKRAQEMLEQFGLVQKAKEQFFRLSGGMQKRLLVARALMSQPKLLILDEPTAGVDVGQRHELWKHLKNLNQDGTTILLTTHYIDEAEHLCERIGIINHGKLLELGKTQDLINKYCETKVSVQVDRPVKKEHFSHLDNIQIKDQNIEASSPRVGPLLEKILNALRQDSEARVLDVQVQKGNLEEVFLKVTGENLKKD
ncbi:MAG: ABC transporter ATP-binding protein [Deltaproteobacteria bacterium]|nr:ABC transporter ATP-binding protein [Deltaproteobacteria bacterium]